MESIGLYLHIPFCVKKCNYCDFLSAPSSEKQREQYVDALCREIEQSSVRYGNRIVDTVFFGGGTPSLLLAEETGRLMETLRRCFSLSEEAEITLEMNPSTADDRKLQEYRRQGINRLSIGLQSACNEELKTLGRIHTWEGFLTTWEMVRNFGFTNVNIDLMSSLPGQSLESWEDTLNRVLALGPEHISAYSLMVEEGTPFYEKYGPEGEETALLPDEETDRQMYELTGRLLKTRGYHRYEISNYAREGFACRHNIGYWKRKNYLGLGLGAASLMDEVRFANEDRLETYLEKINRQAAAAKEVQPLSPQEQREEFMFLGLRMMEGVSASSFREKFGCEITQIYGSQLEKLLSMGLLIHDEKRQRYALSPRGIDVSNQVFVEFL
jgi:oxygen-independent coproporphyrinogen-3 oxidase